MQGRQFRQALLFIPEINDLNLDAAGIKWDKRGVLVNEFLQSVSNLEVYAAGDAASGGLPLAPVASYEGQIVAANLLKGNHERPNYIGIPSVVFTIPPLAAVGLSERRAREQNLEFTGGLRMWLVIRCQPGSVGVDSSLN